MQTDNIMYDAMENIITRQIKMRHPEAERSV